MINTKLLKEESSQVIFLKHEGVLKKGRFMWFHRKNIEIILDGSITLLSIRPTNFNLLSFE